jgi:hypothetical protein
MDEDNRSDNNEGGQWVFMASSTSDLRRTACEASSARTGANRQCGAPHLEKSRPWSHGT